MTEVVAGRDTGLSSPTFREEGVATLTREVPILENLKGSSSVIGEEFRVLRAKVQAACQQRRAVSLAVISALPGEGKSTVALGLAAAWAREPGRRVLLVESDLRRPSISRELDLPPSPGLAEWLNGDIDYIPLRRIDPGGFFLLGCGEAKLERPEALGSQRMEGLLRAAREPFDLTIFDAAPILSVADVILMQDLLDTFLFVVRSRMTPRSAVHDALSRIHADKVVGMVLNDHHEYRGSYMSRAYEGYGMDNGAGRRRGR